MNTAKNIKKLILKFAMYRRENSKQNVVAVGRQFIWLAYVTEA